MIFLNDDITQSELIAYIIQTCNILASKYKIKVEFDLSDPQFPEVTFTGGTDEDIEKMAHEIEAALGQYA